MQLSLSETPARCTVTLMCHVFGAVKGDSYSGAGVENCILPLLCGFSAVLPGRQSGRPRDPQIDHLIY